MQTEGTEPAIKPWVREEGGVSTGHLGDVPVGPCRGQVNSSGEGAGQWSKSCHIGPHRHKLTESVSPHPEPAAVPSLYSCFRSSPHTHSSLDPLLRPVVLTTSHLESWTTLVWTHLLRLSYPIPPMHRYPRP